MKSSKTNDLLIEVLALIQAATRVMSAVTDERLDNDGLLKTSSADDELDFQELRSIAEYVGETLRSLVPKIRLLLYVGAPKGTVYRKRNNLFRTSVKSNAPLLDMMELLEAVDKVNDADRPLTILLLQKQLLDYSNKQCPAPTPTAEAK